MKKANRFFIAIIFCFMLCFSLLTGCNQDYNDLENDCKGKWTFSDFYVHNNKTLKTIRYSDLGETVTGSLNVIVKEIGDYYQNSILNLNGTKSGNKISGTYIKDEQTTKVSWWCPENELKIAFDSFTMYSVQGTESNPTKSIISIATCLVANNELNICYRTSAFSSYIRYTK